MANAEGLLRGNIGAQVVGNVTRDRAVATGLPSLILDNLSILDKSATFTKVGALTNKTALSTVVLTDSASGRFILTSAGEMRAGLVITDRAGATSHSVTIRETLGALTKDTTLIVNVTAITATTLGGGGSMTFPRRNGPNAAVKLAGPTFLQLFGNNADPGVDGVFAFRYSIRNGSLVAASDTTSLNAHPYVMGTGNATVRRGLSVRYFGPDDASTGYAKRICFFGGDQTTGNCLGDKLSDGSTSATGAAGTDQRACRSAQIGDNEDGLVMLVYLSTAQSFGGNAYSARTFVVYTITGDGTATLGDTFTNSAWRGMASSSAALGLGTYTANGGLTISDYFIGSVSDIMQIRGVVGALTDWQEIAKGRSPQTFFAAAGSASGGSNRVARHWPLASATTLALAAGCLDVTGGTNADGAFTVPGNSPTTGGQIAPTYNGTIGLKLNAKGDGYVYGLEIEDNPSGGWQVKTTSRSIQVTCDVIGTATHVQCRVSRVSDTAQIVDWVRATASAATGNAVALTIPGVPVGMDYYIEARREDDNSIVASSRLRTRVGIKVLGIGQSQGNILLLSQGAASTSVPSTRNFSFGLQRSQCYRPDAMDIGVLEVDTDLSQGMHALSERLGANAPTVPFMLTNAWISGESLGTFYADQVWNSTGSYKAFGDYSTPGSGLVTDALLKGGKDVSFILHYHGGSDVGHVYADLLSALYGGVSTANCLFTNVPTGGGPSVTTSVARNFKDAGMDYPVRVLMIPTPRGMYVTTGAGATQVAYDAFVLSYHNCRKAAAQWTPPTGVKMMVGGYLVDQMFESSTETAHQIATDVRGNPRVGREVAMMLLKGAGLSTYANPSASGAVRTSGTVITLSFTLPNGGAPVAPTTGVPSGFEVSEDSGSTWSSSSFTPAIAGSTVTLTKAGGWAAAGSLRVRINYGAPINILTVGQSAGQRTTNYASENTLLDDFLYETRTDAAPSNGSGIVQGVPVTPTFANLTVT